MRYLTSKLGQFLGLDKIKIIPINSITSRFLIDLNLPCKHLYSKRLLLLIRANKTKVVRLFEFIYSLFNCALVITIYPKQFLY